MKTLKELVIEQRCRKGAAAGTTKRGAYWVAGFLKIRGHGGDGVGQNGPRFENFLSFRHYRSGGVAAVVRIDCWHQNTGEKSSYHDVSKVLDCHTVEDVIVTLKGEGIDGHSSLYSDSWKTELTEFLTEWGMPESLPAPDENPA